MPFNPKQNPMGKVKYNIEARFTERERQRKRKTEKALNDDIGSDGATKSTLTFSLSSLCSRLLFGLFSIFNVGRFSTVHALAFILCCCADVWMSPCVSVPCCPT